MAYDSSVSDSLRQRLVNLTRFQGLPQEEQERVLVNFDQRYGASPNGGQQESAWEWGQREGEEILRQEAAAKGQAFPQPVQGPAQRQDSSLVKGVKNAAAGLDFSSEFVRGDTAKAADALAKNALYNQQNPGSRAGQELRAAWESGGTGWGSIIPGAKAMAQEIKEDFTNAPNVIEGLKETGRNIAAAGGLVAQTTVSSAFPMATSVAGALTGGAAGGAAGSAVPVIGTAGGAAVGGVAGLFTGASAGNAAAEMMGMAQELMAMNNIDTTNPAAVKAFLDENRELIIKQAGIKGGVLGAFDTLTMGLGSKIMGRVPSKVVSKIMGDMGVDVANKAAVKAAKESAEYQVRLAADPTFQATQKGLAKIGKLAATTGLETFGEGGGEYFGTGVATGEWNPKAAVEEAFAGFGTSVATAAGQKAWHSSTLSKPESQEDQDLVSQEAFKRNTVAANIRRNLMDPESPVQLSDIVQLRNSPEGVAASGTTRESLDAIILEQFDNIPGARPVVESALGSNLDPAFLSGLQSGFNPTQEAPQYSDTEVAAFEAKARRQAQSANDPINRVIDDAMGEYWATMEAPGQSAQAASQGDPLRGQVARQTTPEMVEAGSPPVTEETPLLARGLATPEQQRVERQAFYEDLFKNMVDLTPEDIQRRIDAYENTNPAQAITPETPMMAAGEMTPAQERAERQAVYNELFKGADLTPQEIQQNIQTFETNLQRTVTEAESRIAAGGMTPKQERAERASMYRELFRGMEQPPPQTAQGIQALEGMIQAAANRRTAQVAGRISQPTSRSTQAGGPQAQAISGTEATPSTTQATPSTTQAKSVGQRMVEFSQANTPAEYDAVADTMTEEELNTFEEALGEDYDGAFNTIRTAIAKRRNFFEAPRRKRTQFYKNVRKIVNDKQADAITTLVEARAASAGMTPDEYFNSRQLTLKPNSQAGTKQQQQDNKGAFAIGTWLKEHKAVIHAFESADVSTLAHELAHLFRQDLAVSGRTDLLQAAEAWAGVQVSKWSTEAEEKFARAFERYLRDGKAPNEATQPMFEAFKKWLTDIYKKLSGSSIDVQITPEIRAVFDALLTKDQVWDAAQTTEATQSEDLVFQKALAADQKKNLYVAHNINARGLRHILKLGGMPAPSLAVASVDGSPYTSFGDITLLADPEILESSKAQVFDADVYTPRFPSPRNTIDYKKFDELVEWAEDKKHGLLSIDYSSMEEAKDHSTLMYNKAIRYAWLKEQGQAPRITKGDEGSIYHAINRKFRSKKLEQAFEQWAVEKFSELVQKRQIFKGYTYSGKRRYIPYTLDNILKEMTGSLRNGEGVNVGAANIRAAFTKKFKGITDIQRDRKRIISKEEFQKIKEESQNKLLELLDWLKPYYKFSADSFGYFDDASSAIAEGPKGLREAFDLDAESRSKINAFVSYLKELPTEYFEAKIQLVVDLNEFSTAVVPAGESKEIVGKLRDMGLAVKTYKKGDGESRLQVVRDSAMLFQEGDRQYEMKLEKKKRTTKAFGTVSAEERAAVAKAAKADKWTKKQEADFLKMIRETKRKFPAKDGWAPLMFKEVKITVDEKTKAKSIKPEWVAVPYTFHRPPGATRAPGKIDQVWAGKIADKMTEEIKAVYERAANGDKNAQVIVGHSQWYRGVTEVLRRDYGGAADLLADLLGATSPNTPVPTNWRFALEILERFSRGEFAEEMKAFADFVETGKPMSQFPDIGKIRQMTGKLYGMNSVHAMRALAGVWRIIEPDTAPKARNFALNLIGQSDMAIIDVWAARSLQRIANGFSKKEYKRVPPDAESGVSGKWNVDATRVGGAYGFGAEVMAQVSQQLKDAGHDVQAPDVQALAWFMEKELWGTEQWTSTTGEGGSFEQLIAENPTDRWLAGWSIQEGEQTPAKGEVSATQAEVFAILKQDPAIITARVTNTVGLYGGTQELSFDTEWVVRKDQFDPRIVMSAISSLAKQHNQYDIFVSKVLSPNESSPNARPGIELAFKDQKALDAVQPILDQIVAKGVDGFTLVVDPRANQESGYIGVRLQYVPEIAMRWDEEARERLMAPGGIEAEIAAKTAQLLGIVEEIGASDGVAHAAVYKYDTVVAGKEDYDAFIVRGDARDDSGRRSQVWFGQPIRTHAEAAIRRYEVQSGEIGATGVPDAGVQVRTEGGGTTDTEGGLLFQLAVSTAAPTDRRGNPEGAGRLGEQGDLRSGTASNVNGLPVREDGRVGIVHFSRQEGLQELDPAFHGTGLSGAESRRKENDPKNWVDRTYFAIEGGGYRKEVGLGPHRYNASLAPEQIYDFNADPDGLRPQALAAVRQNPFADATNVFERLIRDAGYAGYQTNRMGLVAAVFEKTTPESTQYQPEADLLMQAADLPSSDFVKSLKEVDPKSANFKKWFQDSKIVDEEGNPLAVVSGLSRKSRVA